MEQQNTAEKVIDKLGGTGKAASMLGESGSTISSWKIRGRIPSSKMEKVLSVARENGIPLTAEEIIGVAP